MKIEIEVYDLNEDLYLILDNKVGRFSPKSLKIESKYSGYTGNNWGDISCGKGGGFPINVYYGNGENPESWINHSKLFRTKEELLKSL